MAALRRWLVDLADAGSAGSAGAGVASAVETVGAAGGTVVVTLKLGAVLEPGWYRCRRDHTLLWPVRRVHISQLRHTLAPGSEAVVGAGERLRQGDAGVAGADLDAS